VDELPVDELPVDELPVDELPVDELPVDELLFFPFIQTPPLYKTKYLTNSIAIETCLFV